MYCIINWNECMDCWATNICNTIRPGLIIHGIGYPQCLQHGDWKVEVIS